MKCPLCETSSINPWSEDELRPYFKCQECSLIFVPSEFILSPEDEKKRYDTHENNEEDLRYREYLSKIVSGAIPHLSSGMVGLDFGCGASILLAKIFDENGFLVDSYDIFYHPKEEIWQRKYDFIVLSEVIEHLSSPAETMRKLAKLLTPHGQFFIKTKFSPEFQTLFSNWYYKKDPTHICFFNEESMKKLAHLLGMKGAETYSPDLTRLWF
jgi:hypothetical protein